MEKASAQLTLAFNQRLAGDTAGAKLTAEQARNTLELAYKRKAERHDWRSGNSRVEGFCLGLCHDGEEGPGPKRSTARSHALAPR